MLGAPGAAQTLPNKTEMFDVKIHVTPWNEGGGGNVQYA